MRAVNISAEFQTVNKIISVFLSLNVIFAIEL